MNHSAALILLLCTLFTCPLNAQPSPATKDAWQLVPPDGVALVTLQVKSIVSDESMRMMPWEVLSTAGKQQLGIDPMTLERVDVIACAPGVAIRVGGMLTFQQDLPADFTERFQLQDVKANKGVELFAVPGTPDFVFYKKDARHLVVGTKAFVMSSAKTQPGDGPLRKLATGLGEPGPISLVMALEPVREVLSSFIQSPPLPDNLVADVQTVVTKADMLAMRVNLGPTSSSAMLVQTKSPSDASEVSAAMVRLIQQGTSAMIASVQQQAATAEGRVPPAAVAYLQRLAPEVEKNTTFKVNGNRLLLTLDGNQLVAGQVGVGVGLLLPAIQSARIAARRMQSQNNLKQMVLGILNFESTFKRLPMDKNLALDQKSNYKMQPNLSWRVQILPFIEQNALYQEFHLDEPWDSPHNIKLVERMPEIYRHPQSAAKPGHTVYQQPTGKDVIQKSDYQRMSLGAITDGISNTICIVETKDEVAVPWTKPGDVNPLDDFDVLRNDQGVFGVAFVDGFVLNVSVTIDRELFKAMLTTSGGEATTLR